MKKISKSGCSVFFAVLLIALNGCAKKAPESQAQLGKNLVTAGNCLEDKTVADGDQSFRVMAGCSIQAQAALERLLSPNSVEGKAFLEKITRSRGNSTIALKAQGVDESAPAGQDPTSLVVGIPVGMIGEQYFFDGIITQVSDQNNQDLGGLKLSDLIGVQAKLQLAGTADKLHLALMGCMENCSENSKLQDLQDFPVVSIDAANNRLMIDLASVAKDLDLMALFDPTGEVTHLQSVSAKTVSFDYSLSTLVFDVESHMIPMGAKPTDPGVTETVFTTRWFLRLNSAFNPAFTPRAPTPGVGFFLTQRSQQPRIQRWSLSSDDAEAPLHYYVKNVPAEYQPAFKAAFDEWNTKLNPIVGKDVFSYEFVAADDPKNALLVAGDPRFNIVEWDLKNKAPYGGLGPSFANQYTGETMVADVLVQGPTIESLYKDWFKVNKQAQALRAAGQARAADALLVKGQRQAGDRLDAQASQPKFELKKGALKFKIHSQLPELSDPIAQRNDFDPLPTNLDYDTYMFGYFRDMLMHELGHNLGLRHNFRGNLGSTATADGKVSRSVMEYLGRDYRYLDHVGEYDLMALSYGYTNQQPTHTDWYCTDEDKASEDSPTNSAECSADDATSDPFSWFQMRLSLAINYLVDRDSKDAPLWTVDDMTRELKIAVIGMGYYASSATATASTWTGFFTGGERPADAAGVKPYVLAKLKAQICDPKLDAVASAKGTADAQAKTSANITALRSKTVEILAPLKIFTADDLKCTPAQTILGAL